MAFSDRDRLRLYLRDRKRTIFRDDELDELIAQTGSVEEAAGLGWLLRVADATERATSKTWGDVSETYTGSSESAAFAAKMASFWFARAGVGVARIMEFRPGDGLLSDIYAVLDQLVPGSDYDLSRLLPA